jgi:hypothetical protein
MPKWESYAYTPNHISIYIRIIYLVLMVTLHCNLLMAMSQDIGMQLLRGSSSLCSGVSSIAVIAFAFADYCFLSLSMHRLLTTVSEMYEPNCDRESTQSSRNICDGKLSPFSL